MYAFTGLTVGGGCFDGQVLGYDSSTKHMNMIFSMRHGVPSGPRWFAVKSFIDGVLVGLIYQEKSDVTLPTKRDFT